MSKTRGNRADWIVDRKAVIFITTAIVAWQGYSTNYIALIPVQCILMGATIDCGILLFDNYREMQQIMRKFSYDTENYCTDLYNDCLW